MKWLLASLLLISAAADVSAQTVTGEATATIGASSDDVQVAATQARVFGQLDRFRFFAEGAWTTSTTRPDGRSSEAFATAYPYEGPPHVMDAYVERRIGGDRVFGVVRGGRFRTPFGIHDASDYAYNGFLRAPLIRYEGYWSLTNTLFEHGVNAMVGTPHLQGEITVGRPGDVSEDFRRRAGADVVLRAQAFAGSFVVGLSHLEAQGYDVDYASGRMVFTGVDVRWMRGGVQLRTEWLVGRPWDQSKTSGGYVDITVHRPFMGPATLVARAETLDYDVANPTYADEATGVSLGTRTRLARGLFGQVNVTHRPSAPYGRSTTATDVALTYTARFGK